MIILPSFVFLHYNAAFRGSQFITGKTAGYRAADWGKLSITAHETCALWQMSAELNLRIVAKIDKYKVAHCGKRVIYCM
jgi:hypothetical protein